jgi:hypothetical protein
MSNKTEACFFGVNVCVLMVKYIRVNLELLEVGGCEFIHPCGGSWNSHNCFKLLLVDTCFDMPNVELYEI